MAPEAGGPPAGADHPPAHELLVVGAVPVRVERRLAGGGSEEHGSSPKTSVAS
jgi:hypothetical protein